MTPSLPRLLAACGLAGFPRSRADSANRYLARLFHRLGQSRLSQQIHRYPASRGESHGPAGFSHPRRHLPGP